MTSSSQKPCGSISGAMAHPSSPPGPALQRDFLVAPITALAFYHSTTGDRYLLVAEDTDIKVYDTTTPEGSLVCQFRVFEVQSIHGLHIRPSPRGSSILVWGNQSLAVLPTHVIESRLSSVQDHSQPEISETRAPDWIFDGVLTSLEGQCFLVTAHNEVLEVTWDPAQQQRDSFALRFGRVIYPARPALYSARLTCTPEDEVLVAGGTVFGEIVVWKCTPYGPAAPEVLFIFSGHEGSIFGVDFSEEVAMPDGSRGRLLASCSDDRTVRVWDVSDGAARGATIDQGFYEARETGFRGGIDAALSAVQDRTGAEVAVTMGHVSRIWGVRFGYQPRSKEHGDLRLPMYSFGEDSTVSKWHLDIDMAGWQKRAAKQDQAQETASGDISTLTHVATFSYHGGKHIWAADLMHTDQGQRTVIATGGADGRVNLVTDTNPLKASDSEERGSAEVVKPLRELQSVVVKDLINSLPLSAEIRAGVSKSRRNILQRFAYLTDSSLLAVTNSGALLLGTFEPDLAWTVVPLNDITYHDLAHCSSLQSPAPGVAVLATTTKKLFLYQDRSVVEIATLSAKVSDLFCINPIRPDDDRYYQQEGGPPDTIELLALMIGEEEVMQLLTVDVTSRTLISTSHVTDQDSNYTVTSASLLSPDILAIGSRFGHVGLFKKSGDSITLLSRLSRDTSDAITAIIALPNQDQSLLQGRFLFLTTCRDGYYRLYESSPSASGAPIVRLLHETSCTSVPSIENAWFTASSPAGSRDLILVGFRGKTFTLHNETLRLDIAALDCGGGHRAFAYRPLSASKPSSFRLAFNRNLDLGVYIQHSVDYATPKSGTHGREIRAVAVYDRWIATGSEDTGIRIWEYTDSPLSTKRSARCVAGMKVHRAGLQAIKWAPLPRQGQAMLFSCAGNEEFVVWRVRHVEGAGDALAGPAVLQETVFKDTTPDKDLRIMDFDITVVEADEADEGFTCLATMAFSNSTFKTYRYSTAAGFSLVAGGRYTGACITKIQLLGHAAGLLEMLTASSDGHIAIWTAQLPSEATPAADVAQYNTELVTALHQNSIKALELRRERITDTEERFNVISGGDDDALVITELRRLLVDGQVSYTVASKHGVQSAHAAAINALIVLPAEDMNDQTGSTAGMTFLSASNDQRVKVWRVRTGIEGQKHISLLGDRNSAVADPGDLAIINHKDGITKIAVVGVGMEVWRFSNLHYP